MRTILVNEKFIALLVVSGFPNDEIMEILDDKKTSQYLENFAKLIIKENATFIKKQADWWGSMDDEVKNYVIIDSANKLLKHYGLPDE